MSPHPQEFWIVFEIMAIKFMPHFEGEKEMWGYLTKKCDAWCALWMIRVIYNRWMWSLREYNGHNNDTPK